MANKKKEGPSIDTNAWMTTYTDLMILLLTFFVLLLSLSTVDKRRQRLAINSFVGAFGFKPGGQSILGNPKGLNITIGTAPLAKEDVRFEELRNIALKHELESDLNMAKQLDRTVISINNRVLFKPGSYQINPKGHDFLLELAEKLREGPRLIELRGYSDHIETTFEEQPLKYSMHLSTKRAFAVFNLFKAEGRISPNKMVAHGFGNNSTRGKTEEKHGLNRQVEIILDYHEDIPHRFKKTRKKDSLLDFKGFLFKTPVDVY